ncbi:HDOD domain-containing protein [Hahella ganghwensis]|uniref:HDOD domain-containing protein n=1 Tax=Hahella ganghwensis TaxID=286420 RepID=UPI000372E3D0|nr:HDOD domain-containing protein [Hahella ganghwensis]
MNTEDLIANTDNLFALPDVVIRLQEILEDKASTLEDVADVVSLDPVLTSKLLKLANSAFYTFAAKIDTIPRAINIIGADAVFNLALANSALDTFNRLPKDVIDLDRFWRISVDCALIAKQLGKSVSNQSVERLFVTGLLHNIGELICVIQLPEQAREIASESNPDLALELQSSMLGFTYLQLSMEFMKGWQLPPEIYEVVGSINDPEASRFPIEATLMSLARKIAYALENREEVDLEQLIQPLQLELLNLDMEDIVNATDYANLEAINVLSILSPQTMAIF